MLRRIVAKPQIIVVFCLLVAAGCGQKRYAELTLDETFAEPAVRRLAQAASKGDLKEVDRLIARGVDVNAAGKGGITVARWVLIVNLWDGTDNCECFARLLASGANPNARIPGTNKMECWSVMYAAAEAKDCRYLEAAIKAHGDVNLTNQVDGQTPLFGAVLARSRKNIQLLIANGADPNIADARGTTPLLSAAAGDDWDSVYLLLSHGANPALDPNNLSRLRFLLKNERLDPTSEAYKCRQRVVELLKQKGVPGV